MPPFTASFHQEELLFCQEEQMNKYVSWEYCNEEPAAVFVLLHQRSCVSSIQIVLIAFVDGVSKGEHDVNEEDGRRFIQEVQYSCLSIIEWSYYRYEDERW